MVQRMSRARRAMLLLALVLPPLVCGSCRRAVSERLTLTVGGAPDEVAFWEQLARQFEEQTGIAVEVRRQPAGSDERRTGLVTPLRAHMTDPDVFLMDVAWVAQFVDNGWLEPLDARLEAARLDADAFYPAAVAVARQGDDTYALPVNVDGGLLYYRTDLLEKYGLPGPPQTWEQLVEYARTVQQGERAANPSFHGYVWQGAQYEGLVCNWLEAAGSRGGGFLRDGQFALDTPPNVEATQFLHDLVHVHQVSPPDTYTAMTEEPVREAFQRGDALFERNWPYAWARHQAEDSPVRGQVGIAPLPHGPGGRSVSTLGGWLIGISASSDRKEDAARFVAFVLSPAVQKRMAMELGWNPGRRDVYDDPAIAENPATRHLVELRDVFDHLRARPAVPYYTQVSAELQRLVNAAVAGQTPPAEAMQAAQREVQTIVERHAE